MKRPMGVGVGGASVLVVFVTLCLTTFATLSLVTAQADLRLSRRAADTLSRYYAADYDAAALLSALSDTLDTVSPDQSDAAYFDDCARRLSDHLDTLLLDRSGGLTARFELPVDESRALSVAFAVQKPPAPGGARFVLLEWKTVDAADWAGDENLGLWPGAEGFGA